MNKAAIAQKEEFLKDIRGFFGSEQISLLVQQIGKVLALIQHSNMEQVEQVKNIVNCVFDCFMPEMQDEVVRVAKSKESKLHKQGKSEASLSEGPDAESKYVSMEPITKILPENERVSVAAREGAAEEGSSLAEGSSLVLAK